MKLDKSVQQTLKELGYNVHSRNSNLKWIDEQGNTLITAQTPSDHRASLNILSTAAKQQGTTIHGLQEVMDRRREEHRQRRLTASSPVDIEAPVEVPVEISEPKPEPVQPVSVSQQRLQKKEQRLLRRWEAEEEEKQRQRALLLPTFIHALELGHDLLSRDLEATGGYQTEKFKEKYEHYAINAAADMNAFLRLKGFAKSRMLLAEYTIDGDIRGFVFVIECCGFYLDPLLNTIEEKLRWVVHNDLIAECYHEMRLTHNKNYSRYRVSAEWFCDRCRTLGKPEHQVGVTLLCKRCFKEDPSEKTAEFMDRYSDEASREQHCGV